MHQGASSVVSAFRPIDDVDATLFAEPFQNDFFISDDEDNSHNHEDSQENEEQWKGPGLLDRYIINLACVNQQVVLLILTSESIKNKIKESQEDSGTRQINFKLRRWQALSSMADGLCADPQNSSKSKNKVEARS